MKLGERKIMKFFKKALIATAVVSTFGAQAVSLTSGVNHSVSQQGVDADVDAIIAIHDTTTEQDLHLQFSPGVETPAASTITLTFSDGVDLGGLFNAGSVIDNAVNGGTGALTLANGEAYFNYGTGDSTFDNLTVGTNADGEDFIQFEINDGNALEVNSSFSFFARGFSDANGIEITGADEVCYESRDPADDLLEEGCFPFSKLVDQFALGIKNPLDGRIERTAKVTFARNHDSSGDNDDSLTFTVATNEGLAGSLDNADIEFSLTGNFRKTDNYSGSDGELNAITVSGSGDEITFDIANTDIALKNGAPNEFVLGFEANNDLTDSANYGIPVTGDTDLEAAFIVGSDKNKLNKYAGEWRLDAAIINVPYVPVLFADTASNVHIVNESNAAAEVRATMVSEAGLGGANQTRSAEVILGTVPANSVVKFTQGTIADAFGITTATKLSVTFNIDAMPHQVEAYATVQNGKGRTEVSNSQQIEGNLYPSNSND
jgi:hypothetical protein